MKLDEFLNTYANKKVDFDGVYGYQCVDLFRQYCKDVLNIEHTGSVNGAKDLWLNYDNLPKEKKYFIKSQYFKVGDVAIWGETPSNPYGHVAIALYYDIHGLLVFEQNGFKQDGALFKLRSTDNLLGFLHFKKE